MIFLQDFFADGIFTPEIAIMARDGLPLSPRKEKAMIIFVAGVHGVGKSHICKIASSKLGVLFESASSIIRKQKSFSDWSNLKLVADIDENQHALNLGVKKLVQNDRDLILDGHFVLRKSSGGFARVSAEVFQSLSLSAAILIEADSDVIKDRLVERDGNLSPGDIDAFIELERSQAVFICERLSIPLVILNSPCEDAFLSVVSDILKLKGAEYGSGRQEV